MIDINILRKTMNDTLTGYLFEEHSKELIIKIERDVALRLNNLIDFDLDYEVNAVYSMDASKFYIQLDINEYNLSIASTTVSIKEESLYTYFNAILNKIISFFK